MEIQEIYSAKAPKPVGSYSQAVRIGKLVFCSGQIGLDPGNGDMVDGGVEKETMQAMENITAVLSAAGVGLSHAVRLDVFLTDMADYQKFNEVYSKYFAKGPKPARQTIGVLSLPKNAKVEISCIASLD